MEKAGEAAKREPAVQRMADMKKAIEELCEKTL